MAATKAMAEEASTAQKEEHINMKCLLKDWCKERRTFMKEIKKLKDKIEKLENG